MYQLLSPRNVLPSFMELLESNLGWFSVSTRKEDLTQKMDSSLQLRVVLSKVSFVSEIDENFFFWASGVLSKDAVAGLDELIWCNASSEDYELPGCFIRPIASSFSFINGLLLSVFGITITLLRMEDGDLELEQYVVSMFPYPDREIICRSCYLPNLRWAPIYCRNFSMMTFQDDRLHLGLVYLPYMSISVTGTTWYVICIWTDCCLYIKRLYSASRESLHRALIKLKYIIQVYPIVHA